MAPHERCRWMIKLLASLLTVLSAHPSFLPAQSVEETEITILEVPPGADTPPEQVADVNEAADQVRVMTNALRQEKGLEPVSPNPRLTETARYFAQFMARTRKYGHQADGQRPAERAENHDYEYCIVLENIAYAYKSRGYGTEELAEQIFVGWKESRGHRKNMLNPFVTETAVVIVHSEDGYYFAVQMFGRPESAQIESRFVNMTEQEVEYQLALEGSEEEPRSFSLPEGLIRTHARCRPVKFRFGFMDAWQEVESGTTYQVVRDEDGNLAVAAERPEEPAAESE